MLCLKEKVFNQCALPVMIWLRHDYVFRKETEKCSKKNGKINDENHYNGYIYHYNG